MIPVSPQPEPPTFDEWVRRPGLDALASGVEDLPDYWRRCLGDLYEAYKGICAYICIYIPPVTGGRTVEHFAPKSKVRELAYEWRNYRLVCSVMNSRKRDFEDVLDPFEIGDGWFILDLIFMQVLPRPSLDPETTAQVERTIARLRLNDPECIKARRLYYDPFVQGDLSLDLLTRWSPFVAQEVRRQAIVPPSEAPEPQ